MNNATYAPEPDQKPDSISFKTTAVVDDLSKIDLTQSTQALCSVLLRYKRAPPPLRPEFPTYNKIHAVLSILPDFLVETRSCDS